MSEDTPLASAFTERSAQSGVAQITELGRRFGYHRPTDEKGVRHATVRGMLLETAIVITQTTRPGREQSLALTHLEEAMFWANAAIAREDT